MPERDYHVTVCAACLTASCWHGEFMCQEAKTGGITTRTRSGLDALNREHPDNYSPSKLQAVTGAEPEWVINA